MYIMYCDYSHPLSLSSWDGKDLPGILKMTISPPPSPAPTTLLAPLGCSGAHSCPGILPHVGKL